MEFTCEEDIVSVIVTKQVNNPNSFTCLVNLQKQHRLKRRMLIISQQLLDMLILFVAAKWRRRGDFVVPGDQWLKL